MSSSYDSNNVFARIIAGKLPCHLIFETEYALAILDAFPVARGHALLLPKASGYASIEDMPTAEAAMVLGELPRLVRLVKAATGASGCNIVSNVGKAAGQEVFHPHFHVIPREPRDRLLRLPASAKSMISTPVAEAVLAAMHAADVGLGAASPPAPPKAKVLPATHLVTMGDSTIDNLIWQDKDEATGLFCVNDSVIGQLRAALGSDCHVTNLAADGFTSANVLNGAKPFLSAAAWEAAGEPFPRNWSGEEGVSVLHPLDMAASLHERRPISHVLLSVGGNDVREILRSMHRLPTVVAAFHDNYAKIVDRLVALGPGVQIVLMLQYQVCLTHGKGGYGVYEAMGRLPGPGSNSQKLQALMERIYAPVLELARRHRLPVIDLPRTFDPADASLFRLQIEPSAKGSALIASVVAHAVATHDASGPSRLYSRAPSRPGPGVKMRSELNDFSASAPWTIVRGGKGEGGGAGVVDATRLLDEEHHGRVAAHVEALPHAVAQLVAMGFSEDDVKQALAASGNLPQQAAELLLRRKKA